jgi:hypothetical protein
VLEGIGIGKADPLMDPETDYFKDLRSRAIAGYAKVWAEGSKGLGRLG